MPKKEADGASVAAKAAAILGAIFALAAFALFDLKTAWSTAIGAAIAVANLVALRAIVQSMVRAPESDPEENEEGAEPRPAPADHAAEGRRGGVAWGIFAVFKILLLFGGIWILLTVGLVDPMPLAVGYGVLPLGIVVSSFRTSLAPRR
jgi:hypothetical protein